ncbi:MAG: NUDIX hydrolase [Candidatus Rokubacteria bacterium]|nr:NUDIX hydrolase [Candidatus Rokubacteria bacterium]
MTDPVREYPDAPRVGVGAVVLDGPRVLLVQRGRPPGEGKWSIPGGLVHLGERLEDAVMREVEEECGVRVALLGVCGVIDRVVYDEAAGAPARPAIRYHWVIIDYAARVAGGRLEVGSDAADARWVPVAELDRYDTTAGIADMVRRAVGVRDATLPPEGGGGR